MLLTTCPRTGTPMLRGTRSITEVRNGPDGVHLAVRCHCGGTAWLHRGRQVAHVAAVGMPVGVPRAAPVA